MQSIMYYIPVIICILFMLIMLCLGAWAMMEIYYVLFSDMIKYRQMVKKARASWEKREDEDNGRSE